MKSLGGVAFVLCLSLGVAATAATRGFRIYSTKQITAHVDRFYGKNDTAFATVFCKDEKSEVMFVSSLYPEIDGRIFQFGSLAACEKARQQARDLHANCLAQLLLDEKAGTAAVQISQCK